MFGSEPSGPSGPSGPPFDTRPVAAACTAQPPRASKRSFQCRPPTRAVAEVRALQGRRGRGHATSQRTAQARQGHVGGRCVPHWTAPAGVGATAGAVAAAHLADDHRGPDRLFGPPVGGVDRRVPQEEEHGREFVGQVPGKALGVFQRRRRVDQPTEPGLESAAEHVETAPGQFAVLAAVPHVQAGLEDRLDLRAPGTVGVVFLHALARRSR